MERWEQMNNREKEKWIAVNVAGIEENQAKNYLSNLHAVAELEQQLYERNEWVNYIKTLTQEISQEVYEISSQISNDDRAMLYYFKVLTASSELRCKSMFKAFKK